MKRFQFGLSTVLGYKQQVLDGLQGEYSVAMQQVRKQEKRLQQAQDRYAALNTEFRTAEAKGITIAQAMNYENSLRYLEREIQKEDQLLRQYQKQADQKRKQVVGAHQDVTSLEKLKEKKLESYQKDVQKSEETFMDELVAASRVMEMQSYRYEGR